MPEVLKKHFGLFFCRKLPLYL